MEKTALTYTVVCLSVAVLVLMLICVLKFRNKLKSQKVFCRKQMFLLENERQRLAQELHNQIAQNILFVRNQLIKHDHIELIPAVDDTIAGVRKMIEDLYPVSLEKYGLTAAVETLADAAQQQDSLFISHDLEVLDVDLSADEKINFYRIIEACVSIARQHEETSVLRISAEKTSKGKMLVIQDNGKVLDTSVLLPEMYGSSKILDLQARTEYMKGDFHIETLPGKGTKFTFHIPSKNE